MAVVSKTSEKNSLAAYFGDSHQPPSKTESRQDFSFVKHSQNVFCPGLTGNGTNPSRELFRAAPPAAAGARQGEEGGRLRFNPLSPLRGPPRRAHPHARPLPHAHPPGSAAAPLRAAPFPFPGTPRGSLPALGRGQRWCLWLPP